MKLKTLAIITILTLSTILSTVAYNKQATTSKISADKEQQANFKKNLQKIFDHSVIINHIKPTEFDNVFEVLINNEAVLYTDKSGNYLIQGEIFDLPNKKDLAKDTLESINNAKTSQLLQQAQQLDLSKAITVVKGNGSRKLIVFADPNCGYCKKLEKELEQVNNVTVYIFVVPILGDRSVEAAKNIVCSANPAQIWQKWMLNGTEIPKLANCSNDKTEKLDYAIDKFRELGFSGTPAIIVPGVDVVRGYINAQTINQILANYKN